MDQKADSPAPSLNVATGLPPALFVISVLYGGMVCIAGVLGAKQIALGPLGVEAGIFPYLMLVSLSSAVARLYSRQVADRLVRFGFVPLVTAIVLIWLVILLPADEGMYPPAVKAFPIVLGQGWRLMVAGICSYGVSMTLNVHLFSRLLHIKALPSWFSGALAALVSQLVDTLIFITIAFYGVRPIWDLMIGQALAKVVLSIVLVPLMIGFFVRMASEIEKRLGA